jgi:starch synthase
MKVFFVASEAVPFAKTGGLADVVGALPKSLAALGHEVGVFLPRYRATMAGRKLTRLAAVTLPFHPTLKFATIEDSGNSSGFRAYLFNLPEYFDRDGLYQANGQDYPDNARRFAAFCLGALEFLKRSGSPPDVIHCHDWQSALVPIYLRSLYREDPFFENVRVMFTIHNLGYQGLFPHSMLGAMALPSSLFTMDGIEYYGQVNLLKGGILYSDFISTVSRKYAEEIQTKEYGCGLEGVLGSRKHCLAGILNGVDYDEWNPATDKLLPANYTPSDLKGKETCKAELLKRMGAADPQMGRPVIGIVSRFATQKGFDLIAEIAEPLMAAELYVVALGTGEPQYEALFRQMATRCPDKFLVKVAYDNGLAHQIEAGADMFLMPSRYEPCGLNQIYSLKYGTPPVVRATGGLDDTIEDFDGKTGTGFKFSDCSAEALLDALQRAIEVYRQPRVWRQIIKNGMSKDFSWGQSARQYAAIYEHLAHGGAAGCGMAAGQVAG